MWNFGPDAKGSQNIWEDIFIISKMILRMIDIA